MSRKAKSVWLAVGAVVALIALALPKLGSLQGTAKTNATAAAPRDARMAVRTEILQAENLGDRIVTVGTILPNEEVEIRSEISGKIEQLYFKEGGRAKKGDLLLKLNDAELQAQLQRARYRQLMAEEQATRQRQLFGQKLASEQNNNNAENELNIAKADIQLIQAQIAKTEIRAPFGGMIGLRYVSAGGYLSPTTRITTLQDNHPVKIDFTVPEKYAGAIKIGDRIGFTVQGSAKKFPGDIYALEAKIDPTTRTLHLRALSPNPDGALIPGAFANVEVVMAEKATLMIPSFALIPELKGQRVFLYKNGKAESQPVEIGARTDERLEVTAGVQTGDTLITSAILQLRPGMPVRLAE